MRNGKKTVLLVEDNYQNKVLVTEILSLKGYEIIEATSGTEAIKELTERGSEIDVILMDLHLPQMDGITATRIIKSNPNINTIPILALTASAMKGEEDDLMSKGFDGYVAKPIEVKKLLDAVSESTGGDED